MEKSEAFAGMRKIQIAREEAREGMVLAEAVEDARGRVILAPGAPLTSVIISRLGRWGVESVVVEAPELEAGEEEEGGGGIADPQEREQVSIRLDQAFRLVAEDPNMQIVKKICSETLLGTGN